MVRSCQRSPHPNLERVLSRHLACEWRAPLHHASEQAFDGLSAMLPDGPENLVIDSGCGNGASSRLLARRFPDCLVVGVDKSAARLAAGGAVEFPHREGNLLLLRAELTTFWRLALGAGWRPRRHYLLYPNPWPKPGHLQRRWYAHPVFPALLEMGGRIEMRCNWEVYAREFALAAGRALGAPVVHHPLTESEPISPFERKYRASGHALYSVVLPAGLTAPGGSG